jgi:hypothetical protein
VTSVRRSLVLLRGRLAAAWSAGSRGRRAAMLLGGAIAATLAGAFLFGAWHVLFGGFAKGNWRAGAFGLALAGVSAMLLAGEVAVARRVLR